MCGVQERKVGEIHERRKINDSRKEEKEEGKGIFQKHGEKGWVGEGGYRN